MKRSFRMLATVLGFVFALPLVGCAPGAVANGGSSSVESAVDSPLLGYLGFVLGFGHSEVESRALRIDRARVEENYVARCMHEHGFNYIPYLGSHALPRADGVAWLRDDPDWVNRFGYGVFKDTPEIWSLHRYSPAIWGEISESDPNWIILTALTNAEALEWQRTLWGIPHADVHGCRDQGWQYAHDNTPAAVMSRSEFSVIFDLWVDMLWEVDAEVETNHDWAVCMAEAGFGGFARQRDAEESIRGRVWAETGHLHGEWEWRVQQLRPEVADELRQLELETAMADLNCRTATDFHARVAAHQIEVESAFVARYGAALEEVRLAAEQSGLTWLPDDATQAEQ